MNHIKDWKSFNEGKMIDFATGKEIDDNQDDIVKSDDALDHKTDDKTDDKTDTVSDTAEYADNNDPFIKTFVKEDKPVVIIKNAEDAEPLVRKFMPFMFNDFLFVTGMNESKGYPTMIIVRRSPRSRYGYKIVSNYYYSKGIDRVVQTATEFITSKLKQESDKIKEKADKKAAVDEVKNNIDKYLKVGDVFYDSWGYDQTNVDFYQVVKFNKSSAWLKPIAGENVEGTEGRDCANVKPVKDKFTSDDEIRKAIKVSTWRNDKDVYFASRFGHMSRYTAGDKGVYCSWYY